MPTIEISGKQIATFIQIGFLGVLAFYGMKLVIDSIDPTKKRHKQLSEREV